MTGVEVDGNDVAAVLVAVREAVESARRGGGPALIEAVTYRLGPHTTADDPGRYRDEAEAERWRENDPLTRIQILLEKARGWTQEWQEELEQGASAAIEEAVAKRRGLPLPDHGRDVRPDVRRADRSAAPPAGRGGHMSTLTLAQSLNSALDTALESDERVVLLGEDIGRTGGVFRITDGLREKHGAYRVFDTPVAESGIVGAAFGMAIAGMRPVAEIQFLGFSYPAYDQIINHVARIRNRSAHRFTAPLVIRIPFGGGIGAAEHHSESTEAIYAHIPGLKVVVPSTPHDAKWPAPRRHRRPRPGGVPGADPPLSGGEGRGPRHLLHDRHRAGPRRARGQGHHPHLVGGDDEGDQGGRGGSGRRRGVGGGAGSS